MTECIRNTNVDRNIYSFCSSTFSKDETQLHNCNIDSCRLCCATHDQAFKVTSSSLKSVQECFNACNEKFPLKKRGTEENLR